MIGAAYILKNEISMVFVSKNVYPWTALLHDRANYIGGHAVRRGIHFKNAPRSRIRSMQWPGQCPIDCADFQTVLRDHQT